MRRLFTNEERAELLSNPRIAKVINSNVEFSQEFKNFALLEHYINGINGCKITKILPKAQAEVARVSAISS